MGLTLLLAAMASAQQPAENADDFEIGGLSADVTRAHGESGDAWVQNSEAWVTAPIPLNEDWSQIVLLEVWGGHQRWFDDSDQHTLTVAGLDPGWYGEAGRWGWLLQGEIGLAGDLDPLDGNHLMLGGTLVGLHFLNEDTDLIFGVTSGFSVDGSWALPVLGVDVSLTERDDLTVILPEQIAYHHGLEKWGFGAEIASLGEAYAVRDGSGYLVDYRSWLPAYLSTSVSVDLRLAGPTWLGVYGGVDLFRTLTHSRMNGSPIRTSSRHLGDLDPAPRLGLELTVVVPEP